MERRDCDSECNAKRSQSLKDSVILQWVWKVFRAIQFFLCTLVLDI